MTEKNVSVLITGIGELCTLLPLVEQKRTTGIGLADLGSTNSAWIAYKNGKVEQTGNGPVSGKFDNYKKIDAEGGLVLPGFVDSHTHPIFSGSRSNEFLMRMNGATYQDIATAGGGIASSMRATRNASDKELTASTMANLRSFLAYGVTTIEVKSGYGLSPNEELRLLRILNSCKAKTAQHLSVTCLALHAKSPEYPDFKAYADACQRELLPILRQENLADSVDAFIEHGYFSVDDVRSFFAAAKKLGFAIRLHADEFSDAGGAMFAAETGAASADHLQFVSDAGLKKMAEAKVTATILPGTSLYTKIPFTDGCRIIAAGVPLAIGSDYNPGSCVLNNMSMLATVAAIHCNVPPAAALAGITWVPAVSLGLGAKKGALAPGFDADFSIWSHRSFADWLADFGRSKPTAVFISGEKQAYL